MKVYEDKDATIYVGKLKEIRAKIKSKKIIALINNEHLEGDNVIKMYNNKFAILSNFTIKTDLKAHKEVIGYCIK